MINGRNQDVEILGRTFHVQTEVTAGELPTIRTAVFVGGRVVANRDRMIPPVTLESGEDAVLAEMNQQHDAIVQSVVSRARAYQEVRDRAEPPVAAEIDINLSAASMEPPTLDAPKIVEAVRVRQMLGQLRSDLHLDRPGSAEDIVERLERAAARLESFVAQQGFSDLRIDEQVRYQLLRERLQRWRKGVKDARQGGRILEEMGRLASWVEGINRRADLVSFDRALVLWALAQLDRGTLPETLRPQLGGLRGRSVAFDYWLAEAHPSPRELEAMLRRLFAELGEG